MTRSIPSWEYLFGAMLFILVGIAAFIGPALFGTGSGTTIGIPIWLLLAPWGTILLGIGAYWLWKFDRIHRTESTAESSSPMAK